MVVLWCVLGQPAAADPVPIQGYVSGRLLGSWCQGATPRDREACLSYLRGVFDILNARGDSSLPGGARHRDGTAIICVPGFVPVTEIQILFMRYAARFPEKLGHQAAVLVLDILGRRYPCEPVAE